MKRSKQFAALMCAAMFVQAPSALASEALTEAVTEATTSTAMEDAAIADMANADTAIAGAEIEPLSVLKSVCESGSGSGTSTSYYYTETGLLERMEFKNPEGSITPEYEFDAQGNPSKITVDTEPLEDVKMVTLQLDNVYDGEQLSSVTGHLFADDGREIDEDDYAHDRFWGDIYFMQRALNYYTGYENCSVTFAGFTNSFVIENGLLRSVDYSSGSAAIAREEYDENGRLILSERSLSTGSIETETYTYDEMGKLTAYADKRTGYEKEITFTYAEGKDENGQTTYTSEQGMAYTVDEAGVIRKAVDTYSADTTMVPKQVMTYNEEGRRSKLELFNNMNAEEAVVVYEYAYY